MTDGATIFARASGAGTAAVAIIRLSGPAAGAALLGLTGFEALPPARRLSLAPLRDPISGEHLDEALVAWFPGPQSYTGEDMAEFQVHGGRAVVEGVLAALARRPECRPAEAGEFTRRAFLNGRLDLTAVEGIADLVAAQTAAQRRQALRQAGGGLAALYEGWRAALVDAAAQFEAAIDFSDEADVPAAALAEGDRRIAGLAGEIRAHLAGAERGERLRDGIVVAILGAPNVGKSSLLNRLAGREAAIVAETAGTTRDVVEVQMELDGLPVTIADTAGLRDARDGVEAEGVRRAAARAVAADVRLAVWDASRPETRAVALGALEKGAADGRSVALVVRNKGDLAAGPGGPPMAVPGEPADEVTVSARSGAGMDALMTALMAAAARLAGDGRAAVPTRLRHRLALEACLTALDRVAEAGLPELQAEDVRLASQALGRLTGRVDVEEVLDRIFADFCIGK
ncbi:MAG: tRNA uridine-5-carboxymethylaminomethyl(34) synthesis GTPase MnmE [Rhodospirillaceae bacterium]|nr:tRNA uridine-5-carboxymethylaminomethyl(34) synthesis GTPase MnmE [Rhodospirillaceae bacterium]